MLTHHTKASKCPECSAELDAATASDGRATGPAPGDISVCVYCASALVFDDDMRLRCMNNEDWDRLDAEHRQELHRVRAEVQRSLG